MKVEWLEFWPTHFFMDELRLQAERDHSDDISDNVKHDALTLPFSLYMVLNFARRRGLPVHFELILQLGYESLTDFRDIWLSCSAGDTGVCFFYAHMRYVLEVPLVADPRIHLYHRDLMPLLATFTTAREALDDVRRRLDSLT